MDRIHGVLACVDMRGVREDVMSPLLDEETEALINGPGQSPDNYPWLPGHRIPDNNTQLAILEDGVVIGAIGFSPSWGITAVGFWLTAGARRRGILTTAWNDLHASHGTLFEAGTWERNAAARAFLALIGFKEVGTADARDGRTVHLMFSAEAEEPEGMGDGIEPEGREENGHEQAA